MELDKIQPSQLYISSAKLKSVMKNFASKPSLMEPIPIKKLGDRIVFVDGHTRAFAALLIPARMPSPLCAPGCRTRYGIPKKLARFISSTKALRDFL